MITKEQQDQMLEAAKPLIRWLNENCNPHCEAHVDQNTVELLEGVATNRTDEYLTSMTTLLFYSTRDEHPFGTHPEVGEHCVNLPIPSDMLIRNANSVRRIAVDLNKSYQAVKAIALREDFVAWVNTQFMSNRTIEQRVHDLCVEQLGVHPDRVKPEAKITDDLGADSLDMVELVMAAEEEFNLEIADEDAEKVVTVKDAVDLLTRLTNE